jgi:hypothetical protein
MRAPSASLSRRCRAQSFYCAVGLTEEAMPPGLARRRNKAIAPYAFGGERLAT